MTATSNHPGGVNICFADGRSVSSRTQSGRTDLVGTRHQRTAARSSAPLTTDVAARVGSQKPSRAAIDRKTTNLTRSIIPKIGDLVDEAKRSEWSESRVPCSLAGSGGLRRWQVSTRECRRADQRKSPSRSIPSMADMTVGGRSTDQGKCDESCQPRLTERRRDRRVTGREEGLKLPLRARLHDVLRSHHQKPERRPACRISTADERPSLGDRRCKFAIGRIADPSYNHSAPGRFPSAGRLSRLESVCGTRVGFTRATWLPGGVRQYLWPLRSFADQEAGSAGRSEY